MSGPGNLRPKSPAESSPDREIARRTMDHLLRRIKASEPAATANLAKALAKPGTREVVTEHAVQSGNTTNVSEGSSSAATSSMSPLWLETLAESDKKLADAIRAALNHNRTDVVAFANDVHKAAIRSIQAWYLYNGENLVKAKSLANDLVGGYPRSVDAAVALFKQHLPSSAAELTYTRACLLLDTMERRARRGTEVGKAQDHRTPANAKRDPQEGGTRQTDSPSEAPVVKNTTPSLSAKLVHLYTSGTPDWTKKPEVNPEFIDLNEALPGNRRAQLRLEAHSLIYSTRNLLAKCSVCILGDEEGNLTTPAAFSMRSRKPLSEFNDFLEENDIKWVAEFVEEPKEKVSEVGDGLIAAMNGSNSAIESAIKAAKKKLDGLRFKSTAGLFNVEVAYVREGGGTLVVAVTMSMDDYEKLHGVDVIDHVLTAAGTKCYSIQIGSMTLASSDRSFSHVDDDLMHIFLLAQGEGKRIKLSDLIGTIERKKPSGLGRLSKSADEILVRMPSDYKTASDQKHVKRMLSCTGVKNLKTIIK
ncbi:MAG: hypothetical protein ACRDIC_21275 [bacterium]